MARRTPGERILNDALRLCRRIQDWRNPKPEDVVRVREVIARIAQDVKRLHTASTSGDGGPSPSPRPAVPRVHTPPDQDIEPPHPTSADVPKPARSRLPPLAIDRFCDFGPRDNGPANYISLNWDIRKYGP